METGVLGHDAFHASSCYAIWDKEDPQKRHCSRSHDLWDQRLQIEIVHCDLEPKKQASDRGKRDLVVQAFLVLVSMQGAAGGDVVDTVQGPLTRMGWDWALCRATARNRISSTREST